MPTEKTGNQVIKMLEEEIGHLLTECRLTLSLAESCTGGLISHLITNVPGSSAYFLGSVVAYSNEVKEVLLKVDKGLLEEHGAVSAPVAEAMARGVKARMKSHFALAVTGIAGPTTSPSKEIGLVYIALSDKDGGVKVVEHHFTGERRTIKEKSAQTALKMLHEALSKVTGNR